MTLISAQGLALLSYKWHVCQLPGIMLFGDIMLTLLVMHLTPQYTTVVLSMIGQGSFQAAKQFVVLFPIIGHLTPSLGALLH